MSDERTRTKGVCVQKKMHAFKAKGMVCVCEYLEPVVFLDGDLAFLRSLGFVLERQPVELARLAL
jgi:hypothetical protein